MFRPDYFQRSDFPQRMQNLTSQITPGEHKEEMNTKQWVATAQRMSLHDSFGWTFELPRKIREPFNVNKYIGVDEPELSVENIFKLVPGAYQLMYIEYRLAYFELFQDPRWRPLVRTGGIFKMNTIMRSRKTDNYFAISLTSRVAKVDAQRLPTAHFNWFHIFNEWDGRPLIARPRLFANLGNTRILDMEKALHNIASKRIRKHLGFTKTEWKIIDLRAAGADTRGCAEKLGLSENTVKTHNRQIKDRAYRAFMHRFQGAQEVSEFMQEMKLTTPI